MGIRKRILVVDDEEKVLFILHDALMRLGDEYEIVTVQNGREALDKARAMPFDLVITDLRMPDMDGVELTEAIRALDSGTVVIWITAYGCHKVRNEAARLAVYGCLDKPLEIADIRQTVQEALEATEGHNQPQDESRELDGTAR
jgi:DNA-binding NtrC family response regulator